eukprot:297026_1
MNVIPKPSLFITINLLIITVFVSNGTQFQLSNVTLPQGMGSHFAGIYNDTFTILHTDVIEGVSESASLSITLNTIEWSPNNTTMPLDVSIIRTEGDDAVRVNEKLYIINPETIGGSSWNQMFIYNLKTNQYMVSVKPTFAMRSACVVYNRINNIIYSIGGWLDIYRQSTHRFNVSSNIWISSGANTIYAKWRSGCSLDANNDHIYYFGGYNEQRSPSVLAEIEKYSVLNDQWTLLSSTLTIRRYNIKCRLLSSDANIYCIGGLGITSVLNTVDVFDPSQDTIIYTMYLHVARYYHTVTLWNDDLCLIITGGWDGSTGLNSIETFGDCTAPTKNPSSAPTTSPSSAPSTPPT